MKQLVNISVALLLLGFLTLGCKKTCIDDFEKLNNKISNKGGGSGSSCIEGTWYSDACGDPRGVIFNFNADGTGNSSNPDCNGICTPFVINFSYSVSGSTCSLDYDAQQPVIYCTGFDPLSPGSPADESFTFECDGSTLTITDSEKTWSLIR